MLNTMNIIEMAVFISPLPAPQSFNTVVSSRGLPVARSFNEV